MLWSIAVMAVHAASAGAIPPSVVVYGSTPGAVMTAVAAARTLAVVRRSGPWNVTLLDPGPRLGGMCSGGLGSSDIGTPTVIGGLAHEFFVRVARTYESNATDPQYYLEPHVAEQVFRDMLAEAGVAVLRRGRIVSIATVAGLAGRQIGSITLESGDTFGSPGSVFVDGSYEGDLMARSGISYTWGREPMTAYNESYAGRREPWAMGKAHTGGKSGDYANISPLLSNGSLPLKHPLVTELYAAPFGSGDNKVQGYNFRLCVTTNASNQVPFPKPLQYDRSDWELLFALAAAPGGDTLDRYLTNFGHPLPRGKRDLNNGGIISTDCTGCSWEYPDSNYTHRAEIVQHHKDYQQGFLWTLANDVAIPAAVRTALSAYGLCKDEFVSNDHWPEQLYVREARRMVGGVVYTQNDVLARRHYGNRSVGCGSYNFDAHYSHRGPCLANDARDGCTMLTGPAPPGATVWLGGEGYGGENYGPYEFPLDLLLPKRAEALNFLNPVTPSTTHVSFATVRMEPQFMTLGHSAGVVAALATVGGIAVHDVDIDELAALLTAGKQVLACGAQPGPPTPRPPSQTSFGCVAGYCLALDHGGGGGGSNSSCSGTQCAGRGLGAAEWLIMRSHFGPTNHSAGSPSWKLTAMVDTHLKKSEVNSHFLPPSAAVAVASGTTIAVAAPAVDLEEGYALVRCLPKGCPATARRQSGGGKGP
mmetsp:Transcript_30837/g.92490  ORF Transcript_30837/g.92490 Transcript_30837/m.92490 type:complete len:702 (-) Transcript_30837:227-2332(-)